MKSLFSALIPGIRMALLLLGVGAITQPVAAQRRFELADITKTVGVSDPQLSHANLATNRNDTEVVLIDVATARQRVFVAGRPTVKQARWSPTGDRVVFLARTGTGKEAHT
jgi:hypothetical protein